MLIISAHNDTHFSLLKDLKLEDRVSITFKSGVTQQFKVNNLSVIDLNVEQLVLSNDFGNARSYDYSDKGDVLQKTPYKELVLVTCYPFNSVSNGTSLRYLVNLN